MLKQFLKGSALFTLVAIADKGVAFFLFPLMAKVVALEEYGRIDLLSVFMSIMAIVAGCEIYQAVMRLLPDENTLGRKKIISSALTFTTLLGIVLTSLMCIFAETICTLIFADKSQSVLIYWTAITFYFQVQSSVLNATMRVNFLNKSIVSITLVSILINCSCCIYFGFYKKWGVQGILLGQLCSSSLSYVLQLYCCRKYIGLLFDSAKLKELLSFSGPLIPSSLATVVAIRGDRFVTQIALGITQVGILGVSYRFAGIVNILLSGIVMSLTPLIYENYKKSDTPLAVSNLFKVYLVGCCLAIVAISLVSQIYAKAFLPSSFWPSLVAVPILLATQCSAQVYQFFPGLAIAKKTAVISKLQISTLIVNLILSFSLAHQFGIIGLCVGGLIAQLYQATMNYCLGNKYYTIPFDKIKIFALIISTSLLISTWYSIFDESVWFGFVTFVITAFLANILGIFPISKYVVNRFRKI